jgi:hypothetical protein
MLSTYVQLLCFIYTTIVVIHRRPTIDHGDRRLLYWYLVLFGAVAVIATVWLYIENYASILYIVADYIWIFWIVTNTYIVTKKIQKESEK